MHTEKSAQAEVTLSAGVDLEVSRYLALTHSLDLQSGGCDGRGTDSWTRGNFEARDPGYHLLVV